MHRIYGRPQPLHISIFALRYLYTYGNKLGIIIYFAHFLFVITFVDLRMFIRCFLFLCGLWLIFF